MPIKLVASDLDGTIIDEFNKVAKNNLNAIKKINDSNIGFAVSTGKTYGLSKHICDDFNASYGIFGNGMQIVDLKTGKEIFTNTLSKDDMKKCIKITKENNLHVHLYTNSELVTEELLYMDLRNYIINKENKGQLQIKIVDNIEEFINNTTDKVYKFVISSNDDLNKIKAEITEQLDLNVMHIKKRNKYKDMVINKEYEYLDVSPKNISKGYALEILKNYLNINTDETLAIGDNVNDVDMLKSAGIGVAVNDAYDGLKDVASYITNAKSADGAFAEAIDKYVL